MARLRAAIVGSALGAVVCFGMLAPATGLAANHGKATKEQVTIKITKADGIVWGSVTNSYNGQTCTRHTCKMKVGKGTSVTLTEVPTNTVSWPFHMWKINGHKRGNSPTITFVIGHKSVTAYAVYRSA